jgi:hypothetical protein
MAFTKKCPAQKPVPTQNLWFAQNLCLTQNLWFAQNLCLTQNLWFAQNLWRGDLSPIGCAAPMSFLGLLRNPSGINPLTTGKLFGLRNFLWSPEKFSEHRKAFWPQEFSVVTREVL